MVEIFDLLPIVISVAALCVSLYSVFSNKNREKKQATVDAYNVLQKEVLDKIMTLKSKDVKLLKDEGAGANLDLWNDLTLHLVRIERFSVGVNSGIYDLRILNRLAGSFVIDLYYRIRPIIEKKRELSSSPKKKVYNEFETVVRRLEKIRKIKPKRKK